MHAYLMTVDHYFSGPQHFKVYANNKEEAMDEGYRFLREKHIDNIKMNTLKVVTKLKEVI